MRTIQEYIQYEIINYGQTGRTKSIEEVRDETRILIYHSKGEEVKVVFKKQPDGSFMHRGWLLEDACHMVGGQVIG